MKAKAPQVQAPAPPPAPTRDEAAANSKDQGNQRRKGYQSTILGGRPTTAAAEPTTLKTLLGS